MAKEHAKQIEVTKQALGSALEREKQWKEESWSNPIAWQGWRARSPTHHRTRPLQASIGGVSTTIQEYKDSMVQEPAEDFI